MAKQKKVPSLSELKNLDLTNDDIKVVCPADERLWLTFTRDMTRKQWKAFQDVLDPPEQTDITEEAKDNIGDLNVPDDKAAEMLDNHLEALAVEIERIREERADQAASGLFALMLEVVTDGEFVCGGKTFSGIDKIIQAAKDDELTFIAEGFMVSAINEAAKGLRELGNARRRS